MPMPEENIKLKANGRCASVVRLATVGERQTSQEQRVMPVRIASANCAGWATKQTRNTENTTVQDRPVTSVARMPKRSAQMPAGIVPKMLPNAIKPPISPRERSVSLKPIR